MNQCIWSYKMYRICIYKQYAAVTDGRMKLEPFEQLKILRCHYNIATTFYSLSNIPNSYNNVLIWYPIHPQQRRALVQKVQPLIFLQYC